MNQKEYDTIAKVIKGRKANTMQLQHLNYSERDIDNMLATLNDLQEFMASALMYEYPKTFDANKFHQACAV